MLCCCVASEEGEKIPEIPEIQQRSVLDTAEAKLVEKAIETAPAEIQNKVEKDAKKEPEAPTFGSFSVVVPVKGLSSLGLELDSACELGPMIKQVSKTGAVHVFNELHPGTALKPFDVITSINGVKGNDASEKMMGDEKIEGDVALTVLRPRKVELSLSKTTNLGLKLDFGSASFGAVVREVGKGLVSTWNTTHSITVGENDRVIEVNGTQHLGEDLLAAIQGIQKDSKFSLTVLKY